MSKAPLLLASWLVFGGWMVGCGMPAVAYPSTEAERAGIERARLDASGYLDCEDVEVIPVSLPGVCAADGCQTESRWLGSELVARGCGKEMRFQCDACGSAPDRSYCLPEFAVGEIDCATF